MRQRRVLLASLLLAVTSIAAKPVLLRVAQQWTDPDFERRAFTKVVVLGISDRLARRKAFENKFVSHLRGKGIEAVTSYSIVLDLANERDEQAILEHIHGNGIDGVISVRLVPLDEIGEEAWVESWERGTHEASDLRELIDASLPVPESRARRYGVEAALWETAGWTRVWAGRTEAHKPKELERDAGGFVDLVMKALALRKLL